MKNHTVTVKEFREQLNKPLSVVATRKERIIVVGINHSSTSKIIYQRIKSRYVAVYHNGVHVLETRDYERAVSKYNSLEV